MYLYQMERTKDTTKMCSTLPGPIDEFSPCASLKKWFAENKISRRNKKVIEEFSKQYAVEEEHVISYVQHIKELKVNAQIRARDRQSK